MLNLFKSIYRTQIEEILKILRYGLRFLTEEECKILKSYSMARWNI